VGAYLTGTLPTLGETSQDKAEEPLTILGRLIWSNSNETLVRRTCSRFPALVSCSCPSWDGDPHHLLKWAKKGPPALYRYDRGTVICELVPAYHVQY
jgi:hypothetical protein